MVNINPIQGPIATQSIGQKMPVMKTENNPAETFKNIFNEAIQKVDHLSKESEVLTNKLMTGQVQDIHQVMIAGQKASIALQLTVQVRNKVIESYQEIMRMQV